MILTLYFTFVALSLVILGVGVLLGENYFSFVGLFFLFLLGSSLMASGVDYQTGELLNTTYSYIGNNTRVDSTEQTLVYTYDTLQDTLTKWFGFFMAVAAGAGMAAVLTQANNDFKKGKDYERDFSE